jgi:multisubunit Na+/H+ antiporter MnhG subunit
MTTRYIPRNFGKKIALIGAGSSLACGFLTFGATLWFWQTGGKPIITGSLGATTFFFVTAAIVLYEMSRPLQELPPPEEQPPIDPPRTFT